MSADTDATTSAAADAAAAPLDLLLTDAAVGILRRVNLGGPGLRLAAALAGRPGLVAGRGRQLLGELGRIAVGRSQVEPSRRDRRFADPGWTGNPLLRRTLQAYLAAAQAAEGVVAEAGLDEADSQRVGFALTNLIDALSPSNNPLLNPAAVKAAVDSGGGSAVAGLRHFLADMAVAPRVPSMVEPDAFEVGVDLAVTPGSVASPRILLRMLTPRRHQDPGYAARVAGELYGGSARENPTVARDLLHATTRLGPARGYYYQLIAQLGWTSLPWLPKLRPPTLILAGDDDPIIPLVNARIMHRLIRRSKLHVYRGGHLELAADATRLASGP